MNAEKFTPAAFATGEYAFASTKGALKGRPTVEGSSNLIRKIDIFVDQEIADAQRRYPEKVGCKAGCHYCCRGSVVATGPEIAAIYNHLVKALSSNQMVSLRDSLDEHKRVYEEAQTSGSEGIVPCPLLAEGLCSVYAVRPLICRMTSSFDAQMCKERLENPDRSASISILQEQFAIGECAVRGIATALGRAGYPDDIYLMAGALREILHNPELAEPFLAAPSEIPPYRGSAGNIDFEVAPGEVSGIHVIDSVAIDGQALIFGGKVSEADHKLREDVLPQLLSKLRLPKIYESEDHLLEMRERYERVLDTIIESKFAPKEIFNQLDDHQTFLLAYQGLSVRETLVRHGKWVCDIAQRALPQLTRPIEEKRREGKIRVGYLSQNLSNSNGGKWALGWLENHTNEFETYAILVADHRDAISGQFDAAADHFYKLNRNVQRAAEFIRELDLDVLIFTDIGMAGRNYQYASLRLARVQCTAWGHPVTSGLPTIDYYLSSDFMDPEGAESEYTEKLVRLPRSGLCYRKTTHPVSTRTAEEFGLGDQPFIFMGQNLSKWLPRQDHLLAEIYEKAKRPVIFMGRDEQLMARLRRLGVPFGALAEVSSYEYSRLLQLADVSIDPVDWSGGNTTIEALAHGTPVVTLPGKFMRGRHSLAFHQIAGTGGLIAKDEADYVDLIADRDRRNEIMRNANTDALYEDVGVVRALDTFIIETLQRL